MTSQQTTAMTSAKFSEFVLSIDDLYNMGIRNGFYLPKQSSSAVNELMLTNVLKKNYWCPMTKGIRLKSIVKAPPEEGDPVPALPDMQSKEAEHRLD
jgi:hypothetical protein